MIKQFQYIDLEYTDKDNLYIEELVLYIKYNINKIIDFFKMDGFDQKINIKLFSKLEEFRTECSKIMKNKEITLWLCGLSFNHENQYNIYTLCLDEYKKTKGHNDCSLEELKILIMHEFVHICHQKYTNNTKLPVWMSEGLATTLSHQYDNIKKTFNATLDQIINGGTDYKNYYVMFSYILKNYGKEYILDLLKNEEQLKKITPILYEEVSRYYINNE